MLMHIFLCRHRDPQRLHIFSFLVIALLGLGGYSVIASCISPGDALWNFPVKMTAFVFYLLMIPYYPVFYYTGLFMSPSQQILSLIKASGQLSFDQLAEYITDGKFIISRLNSMVKTGFLKFDGRHYRLPPHAVVICRLLNLYQILLGRKMGG